MDFPDDVDCVIVGTGLGESMIAAALTVTGNSVLHVDRHNYYGGYMTSFRFTDLLNAFDMWSASIGETDAVNEDSSDLDLIRLNTPLIRHCSSKFFVPDVEETSPPVPNETQIQPEFVSIVEDVTEISSELSLNVTNSEQNRRKLTVLKETKDPTQSSTSCTKKTLIEALGRADFDILPRLIFAESPLVNALLRSDVTRYLEFRPVNRLLLYNPEGVDDRETVTVIPSVSGTSSSISSQASALSQATSSLLIKVPVSRGEVFQTRILSLTQKRMLVGFLEWCSSIPNSASTGSADGTSDSRINDLDFSSFDPDDTAYLDRPMVEYLQEKRSLDTFISGIVVKCLAFASNTITLRDALPRLRRLISSMNRVGPFPLLWPLFGCAELPQAFCRMCAVFSGTYCLGRSVTAVWCNSDAQRRRYRLRLSTGEEVSTSCLLIGAEQAPSNWVISQIHRWIARAILVTEGSIFPSGHEPHDITLVPIPIQPSSTNCPDLGFILETPVEKRGKAEFCVVHISATCDSCVDAAELFAPTINRLYSKDATTSRKPRVLWNGFFTLPDLSRVNCRTLGREFGLNEEGIFVVPSPDASMFMDVVVSEAATIFHDVFSLIRRRAPQGESVSQQGETAATSSVSAMSLQQHWDGIFPPQPPQPEDLVFADEQTTAPTTVESFTSTVTPTAIPTSLTPTPTSAHPTILPGGHGDWSVGAFDNTVGESEFTTAPDP